MKILKIFTVAFLFGMFQMNAQETSTKSPISFGVKGGVNFANVTGDDFEGPNARTSFHAGVLMEIPVSNMFSIQAEALYSGQGFKSDINGLGTSDNIEYQLDYINVPILAKIYLTKGLSIEAGPQLSFKVNEEIDADPNNNPGDFDLDEAEDFDFALAAGLTFQTEMGFFASGRYTHGLTDIIKNADVKNSVFQIGIGFKF